MCQHFGGDCLEHIEHSEGLCKRRVGGGGEQGESEVEDRQRRGCDREEGWRGWIGGVERRRKVETRVRKGGIERMGEREKKEG